MSPITTKWHKAFGWNVRQCVMQLGAKIALPALVEVPRDKAPNRAMYVRGRCTVTVDGQPYEDRVPGLYTQERPPHPVGVTLLTAVEETEFWCFGYAVNRNQLPELTPVRVLAGDTLKLCAGNKLFVMLGKAGSLTGPCEYKAEVAEEIEVTEDLFAFLIAEERA